MDPFNLIWNKIEKDGEEALSTDHTYHVERVKRGGYAYITEVTAAMQAQMLDCSLVIMPEKMPFYHFSFALTKGSVFTEDISKV